MNINDAYNNLVNLVMNGRITINGLALTAVEHQQVNNDLKLLYERAVKADEFSDEIKNIKKELEGLKEQLKPDLPDIPEETVKEG